LCIASNNGIHAQVIDDRAGRTLAAADWLEADIKKLKRVERPSAVGKLVAEKAIAAGIKDVVFDRNGYLYHGRVKSLADGAREGGLNF